MAIGYLVERSLDNSNSKKHHFYDDYLVLTSDGFKPIKRVIKTTSDSFVEFVTDQGWILRTTDNHPHIIFDKDGVRSIVQAKDLKEGMKVLIGRSNGETNVMNVIDRVEFIKSSRPINVYDIEIDDEAIHDFFASNILTHNCCRLRIDNRELRKRGGGLFGSNPMTGSVGVVTINMPRIGYLSKTKKELFERLENLMNLAAKSLIRKREIIEKNAEDGLYPYIKIYLSEIKQRMGSYLANHFNTIGLVGLNECCLNFLNKDITTPQGLELSKEILNFMREKILSYQQEYDTPFNLEATPAEATSYKLAKIDVERYKNIITAGTRESPYYTNSSQIDVKSMGDLYNDLRHQNELQPLYTGGTVFHMYLGESIDDYESVKLLLKKICSNFKIPYISFTPTFSICPKCGYISGEHETCPNCIETDE